jgi:N-acetyl-gamma-glutamyl-phosphate reductase
VADTLNEAYGSERFIRLLPADRWPSVAGVRQTNFCDIGWAIDEANRHLILVSAIDNLVKGAAGQAVQCMNIRFDLPEAAGLEGGSL